MVSFAQQATNLSDVPPIRRGTMITRDGKKIEFRNLHVIHDTVIISGKDSKMSRIPGKEVYKISRTGNCVAVAAISCGLGGLLGAVVGTLNWSGDLQKSKGTYIIAATAGCTLLGGIIGLCIPRDIMIYRNNSAISFYPDINFDHQKVYASVLIRIKL